ncbi:hypothetical protein [Guggenheimella bovis]
MKRNDDEWMLSDDEYFTDYLLEDLERIFSGKSAFTPYDWQKFRSGFEFKYQGKDAIVSILDGIVIGFLGEEMHFDSMFKGFHYELFFGKSFYDIWEEISKTL